MCPASHPARRTGLSACQARVGPAPCALLSPLFLRPQEGRSRAKVIVGLAYLRGGLGTQSTGSSVRHYLRSQRTGPDLTSIHRRLDGDTQAQPHTIQGRPGQSGRAWERKQLTFGEKFTCTRAGPHSRVLIRTSTSGGRDRDHRFKMRKLRRGEVESLAPGPTATSKQGSWDLGQAVGVRATLRTTLPHGLPPPPGAPQNLGENRNTRTTFALPSCAGLTNGLR